jgi:hypothetical protein
MRMSSESGDVPAIERDDRRGKRPDSGRADGGARAGEATDGSEEERNGEGALDCLGQVDRPEMQPEEPHRQRLEPECAGELVDAHRPKRIERSVEEVVPAMSHRAHCRRVEQLGLLAGKVRGVRDRREHRDPEERRTHPAN